MPNAEARTAGRAGAGVASMPRRDGVTPLGDQLRAERERRGDGLEKVSDATKIGKRYLEALESHDWKALPDDVFTRGYVRTYAQYLSLDEEHLLKVYARERRIAGVDDRPASGRARDAETRALLKKLAQTRGVKTRRIGTTTMRIVLVLGGGGGVAALAVFAFLHLRAPGRGESRAVEAPSHAERNAVAVAPGANAIGGDNKSPADIPVVAPTAQLPAPPNEPSASHLSVGEFGVGTNVVDHRLVGQGDQFREGTVVWFWTSVIGGRPGDKIRHVWLREGRSVAMAELNVNGAHWRTQSRRPLPEGSTGDWTVEARDAEGHVIARVGFTCLAADAN